MQIKQYPRKTNSHPYIDAPEQKYKNPFHRAQKSTKFISRIERKRERQRAREVQPYRVLACWISASSAFRESLNDGFPMAGYFPGKQFSSTKQKKKKNEKIAKPNPRKRENHSFRCSRWSLSREKQNQNMNYTAIFHSVLTLSSEFLIGTRIMSRVKLLFCPSLSLIDFLKIIIIFTNYTGPLLLRSHNFSLYCSGNLIP